jgi:integrase
MVSVVSLIMKVAIAGGARRDNPAAAHTIPQRRGKLRQGDILTMEQADRPAAAIRDPYTPAVWLMVLLGLRPAELCGPRVRSVDLVRSTVHIVKTQRGSGAPARVPDAKRVAEGQRGRPRSGSACRG